MHTHLDPDQSYAITRAERSTALLPWRYAQTSWEPLRTDTSRWVSRMVASLAGLACLALVTISAWQFIPLIAEGQVAEIAAGSLRIQDGEGGPWIVAQPARMVRPGARLRTDPGTVATIEFADGSLMRVESGGEWAIDRVAISRNTRVRRVRIRQLSGTATFASAPMQKGVLAVTTVDLYAVTLRLAGVATVEQISDGDHAVGVWQGSARLVGYGQRIDAAPGGLMHASAAERSLGMAPDVLSR